jgi:hypothetical protein
MDMLPQKRKKIFIRGHERIHRQIKIFLYHEIDSISRIDGKFSSNCIEK